MGNGGALDPRNKADDVISFTTLHARCVRSVTAVTSDRSCGVCCEIFVSNVRTQVRGLFSFILIRSDDEVARARAYARACEPLSRAREHKLGKTLE